MCKQFAFGLTTAVTLIVWLASAPALARHRGQTLYRFGGGSDGSQPAGVILDNQGNLYGVAGEGGDASCFGGLGCGTVFEFTPDGKKTTLYTFHEVDGSQPTGRLMRDFAGNLYGTTQRGGSYDKGVVFRLSPRGRLTVLHDFTGGNDGGLPTSVRLISDELGDLYGSTQSGGDLHCFQPYGCGVVFDFLRKAPKRYCTRFMREGMAGGLGVV